MIQSLMPEFEPHLVRIGSSGPAIAEPVAWKGHVSEQQLEDLIVANPQLAGEELLVLGRQLKAFQEDDKRLDVLAVDRDGEIVLLGHRRPLPGRGYRRTKSGTRRRRGGCRALKWL